MKMTRDNFGSLLTPVHKRIAWNEYNEIPEQYSKLCDVEKMNAKTETEQRLGGFGAWGTNTEGNTINEDSFGEADDVSFTYSRYDKGYSLTWELTLDDLYGVMKGLGKGGSAQALGKGLRVAKELCFATVVNGGFTNTGYDATSLFSNSHSLASGGTDDNLTTGGVTDSGVKTAITLMRTQKDEAGLKIQAVAKQIWAAANKEWDVYTVLRSTGVAGELSNDKNVLPSLTPVIMDYLTDGYWGLRDTSFENLKFKNRHAPVFDSQPIPKTVDYFMFGIALFCAGYRDYRGLVGSAG
ncbi:MAG: hypothetical protein WC365_08840 [Candidatus Babeliales bacterium]|jgi:hypothetical protein